MVGSLLNERRPGSSWMKKRKKKVPQLHRPAGSKWSTLTHDWTSLNRPATVYWRTVDNIAQAHVYETLFSTLLTSNQVEPSPHFKWVEEYEAAMVRTGTPDHLRHAAMAWILMQSIYRLENDFPLIFRPLLKYTIWWKKNMKHQGASLLRFKKTFDKRKDKTLKCLS